MSSAAIAFVHVSQALTKSGTFWFLWMDSHDSIALVLHKIGTLLDCYFTVYKPMTLNIVQGSYIAASYQRPS